MRTSAILYRSVNNSRCRLAKAGVYSYSYASRSVRRRRRGPFGFPVAASAVTGPSLPAPGLVSLKGPVAEVYGGMMTADHRHLYIVGWMQPRYGIGPLIVPAADLPARIILSQERMRNSVWPDPQATWPKTGTNPSI